MPMSRHVRVQKRFASSAAKLATVPLSQIPKFPPKGAASHPPSGTPSASTKWGDWDPHTWSELQPPPRSALTALRHRVGLGNVLSDEELELACTHPSYLPFYAKHNPDKQALQANGNLATLGNSLLGLFASEFLHTSYPHLPTRVLKAAVSAYVGPQTCANVAKEIGAAPLLRWRRTPPNPTRPPVLHANALSSIPRALTALVYQQRSVPTAREFAHAFFLSRDVDIRGMLKFTDPKLNLIETVAKYGREKPISRLLKETGRHSISPIFVVGVYSGADKLGEGFGSSLKMAEYRACEDALHRLYLTRTPPHSLQLPTSTFLGSSPDTLFTPSLSQEPSEAEFIPGILGESEVLLNSAGRSGIKVAEKPKKAVAVDTEDGSDG